MQLDKDPLINYLQIIIRFAIRVLAILMTFVIIWGIGDVVYELFKRITASPFMLLNISDILATFGAFMAVLIAVEIFSNITMYLRQGVIHVKIVIATALMAISRKVIIFDYQVIEPQYVYATAAVILALSLGYWLTVAYCPEENMEIKKFDKSDDKIKKG